MPTDWQCLFSPGGFRWRLGLRAGNAESFFAPTAAASDLLAERTYWLAEDSDEYAGLTTNGTPLLAETVELAARWGAVVPEESVLSLGHAWEPDFVLLSVGENGLMVEGGAVCFPTGWSLREKLGRSLFETHGVVPELNVNLAARIETALHKLPPGGAWERDNWGLARDAALNRHPSRNLPQLDATITPGEVWLRVEHQILYKLPQTGGVLFGIRLALTPLAEILADSAASATLSQALVSMPPEAAAYKGLASARPQLLAWLAAASSD
jgi:hypothetical protein